MDSLRESTNKIAILYDASQAVLSSVDLDEVLSQILTIIRDYFEIQNGTVWVLDPPRQELYVRAHLGDGRLQTGCRLGLDQGLTGAAARLKRPLCTPDGRRDHDGRNPEKEAGMEKPECAGSEVAIPLIVRDELVGVLDVQSEKPHGFDSATIDLLTLVSTQVALALENARVHARERRRGEQLEAINAVARQTTAMLDLDE